MRENDQTAGGVGMLPLYGGGRGHGRRGRRRRTMRRWSGSLWKPSGSTDRWRALLARQDDAAGGSVLRGRLVRHRS